MSMAGVIDRDRLGYSQSNDQERKLNFVAPRRNIRLPRFSVPWAYTKSIITLMETFEVILRSDESLALHMKKTLDAHQLEEVLQQALGCPSPRVIEDNNRKSEYRLPPTWTNVLSGGTLDQFEDQGDHTYRRCNDGVVYEIPAFVFDNLENLQSMIGPQPTPSDMRLEADVVSAVSDQLTDLVKVLTETREHVLRVQSGFQTRSDAIRRYFETQTLPVSDGSGKEREQSSGTAHNLSSQYRHQSLPTLSQENHQATRQKEAIQDLSSPTRRQSPLHVGPEEQAQERRLKAIGNILEGHAPAKPILNMSRKKNQGDRKMETVHGHSFHPVQQSVSSVSGGESQEARHIEPTPDGPPKYQHQSPWDVSQRHCLDTRHVEASRNRSPQTQHQFVPTAIQQAGQEQRRMEATPKRPARIQIPSDSREGRENSILSSPGGDIPYRAPPTDTVPPGALEGPGGPTYGNSTSSATQNISKEEDDIDMLDDSAYSTGASDARSPTTPNTEIMPEEMERASRRLPVSGGERTGLEGIPVATNGNQIPPNADEKENGYYFMESLKLHGTTWKQIVPLYAHRFNVVRTTNGLQQYWMKWRDQGRKLVVLKYRRRRQQTGT